MNSPNQWEISKANGISQGDGGPYPSIIQFVVDKPCAEPGDRVVVSWRVQPSGATVTLTIKEGEDDHVCLADRPGAGILEWIAPRQVRTATEFTITAVVEASGRSVSQTLPLLIDQKPRLDITGVEITQGIQAFGRVDGTRDNALKVFAHKDTIVRVYVSADRGGFNADLVQEVTGVLEFDGLPLAPINGQTPDSCGSWTGGNPFITARPAAQVRREETDHTLNFRIPAAMATPNYHTLDVTITSPQFCGEPADRFVMTGKWWPARALPVRYVRVEDNHPVTGTQNLPTAEQAECTLIRAFDMLPSPATDIGPAILEQVSTVEDLTTMTGLFRLWLHIEYLRRDCSWWESFWEGFFDVDCSEYDSASIWVGLHDSGFMGGAIRDDNTSVAPLYDPVTHGPGLVLRRVAAAHEIGHCLGFRHVDIDCASRRLYVPYEETYYNPANNGVLWDVPFDPFWNLAASDNVGDFMSYACQAWTSGDSWNQMNLWIG